MGHLETLISLDDDSLGLHCLPRFGNVLIMIHCIQIINNGHGSTTGACVPCVLYPKTWEVCKVPPGLRRIIGRMVPVFWPLIQALSDGCFIYY